MRMPDPKEVFKRLDLDHDGKLSLEEFTAGMKRFHAMMAERFRGRATIPPGGPREMARRMHQGDEAGRPSAGAEHARKGHEVAPADKRGDEAKRPEKRDRARHETAKHRPVKPEKSAKPEKSDKPEPGAKPEAKKA